MVDFSYDLTTDGGKLRLLIGDQEYEAGVKPNGDNFTDTELAYFIAQENTVEMAAARACDVLATMWAKLADLQVGPRRESLSQIALRYAERAAGLRGASMVTGYVTMDFATVDE